jgi:hypothetical protein
LKLRRAAGDRKISYPRISESVEEKPPMTVIAPLLDA